MIKGSKGSMNIAFSEVYDKDSDVYYVSFNTGEPSYIEEIDDIFLLEVGMFTNMPTGFRILNFSKHDVGSVGILSKKIRRTIEDVAKEFRSDIQARERQVENTLQKVFAQ